MLAIREYAYFFLIAFGVPVGGVLGWLTGCLFRRLLHLDRIRVMRDVLLGIAGFLIGTYMSVMGFSLESTWENGHLVFRRVGGFADYIVLVSVTGAMALVAVVYGFDYVLRLLRRRR